MVYNDRTAYNEWEFIFDPTKVPPIPPPGGGAGGVPANRVGTPASQMNQSTGSTGVGIGGGVFGGGGAQGAGNMAGGAAGMQMSGAAGMQTGQMKRWRQRRRDADGCHGHEQYRPAGEYPDGAALAARGWRAKAPATAGNGRQSPTGAGLGGPPVAERHIPRVERP